MTVDLGPVLANHHANVGFDDGNSDNNPWGPVQGIVNAPYCDSAASVVPWQNGYRWWPESQCGEKGCAYCPYHINVGKAHGEFAYDHESTGSPVDVKAGDLLFYGWNNGNEPADHVETAIEDSPSGRTHNIGYNALPVDTPVLTPTGWRRNGDLMVGDEVIDPTTGGATTLAGVYPKGRRPVFNVRCHDGAEVEADGEHLWLVHIGQTGHPTRIMTTVELADWLAAGRLAYLPRMTAAEFMVEGYLPIDSWLLGYLLGDGNLRAGAVRFSSMDQWLVEMVRASLPEGCTLGPDKEKRDGFSPQFYIGGLGAGRRHPLLDSLRDLALAGVKAPQKFIPDNYKWSCVKDRTALLQGLMDADGSVDDEGRIDFTTSSHQLALDVQHLVRSLGGRSVVVPVAGGTAFKQRLVLPPTVEPFRLPRKAEKVTPRKRYVGWGVTSVTLTGEAEVSCFKVASDAGLFVTKDFMVTHNTGSPKGCHDLWRDRKYLIGRLRPTQYTGTAPPPPPTPVQPVVGTQLRMYDGVSWQGIPASAPVVGGYSNHRYVWPDAAWSRFPGLWVPISVYVPGSGDDPRQVARDQAAYARRIGLPVGVTLCLDVESPDAQRAHYEGFTAAWADEIRKGGDSPTFYTSQSAEGIISGDGCDDMWGAQYNGVEHINPGDAATQWSSPTSGSGGQWDLSLTNGAWPRRPGGSPVPAPNPPPPPPVQPPVHAPDGNPFTMLDVDGQYGNNSIHATQWKIGAATDGVFGHETAVKLQEHLGVAADGQVGPITVRALQARVGSAQDGQWGPDTTLHFQSALNAATF